MLLRMLDDFFEDVACSPRWFPTPGLGYEARVEYNPRQVERTRLRLRSYCVFAEPLAAPFTQLAKRDRRRPPAADVRDARVIIVHRQDLPLNERNQVGRMETVPHLIALPAKAGVTQRPATQPTVNPVGEDALVGPPKLAGTRERTAPIDPHWETVSHPILKRKLLACKLRGTIERHRRGCREFFA